MALINTADAVYLGDQPADRIYKGADRVWPAWTPAELFANGEQGGFWDFTTPSGLFQDAIGTVPVENPGDPIGMATDLSGNGNHLLQATVPARPTYTEDGALHDGVDDFLQAALAEDWTFLHDGSGGHMAASSAYFPSSSLPHFGTKTAGGNSVGVSTGLQSSTLMRTNARLANGVAAFPLASASNGSFPDGHIGVEGVELNGQQIRQWSNGLLYAETSIGDFVLSDGPPAQPFNSRIPYSGGQLHRRRMIAISRTLTDAEIASVNAWLMEGA